LAEFRFIDPVIYPDQKIVRVMDSREGAMKVQRALKNGGYYDGKIYGKIWPQTKKAVRYFSVPKS
jgi:hypothetical protein